MPLIPWLIGHIAAKVAFPIILLLWVRHKMREVNKQAIRDPEGGAKPDDKTTSTSRTDTLKQDPLLAVPKPRDTASRRCFTRRTARAPR